MQHVEKLFDQHITLGIKKACVNFKYWHTNDTESWAGSMSDKKKMKN